MLLSALNVPPQGTIRDLGIIWTRDFCRHAAKESVEIDRKNGPKMLKNRE
jgi:hypothetical protein